MVRRTSPRPWSQVVKLRDDLKSGELSLAVFAADLHDVVMQKSRRPVYENPAEFFALTYPTYNLRELVKEVVLRLDGRSDKAYRKLSVNYGGGKTHTLIALRHLVQDPAAVAHLPTVKEFEAHIGSRAPRARVAALCFDKIDVEVGVETPSPDGTVRMLKHPWSILAYQLAGAEGLRLIHAGGSDEERQTPPAEPLVAKLLSKPQEDGLSTLVLLDEVLMYMRVLVDVDPAAHGRLLAFFQYLTQAVVKVDRCAMVASLLASDPRRHDEIGAELLRDVYEVFGRQMEEEASPVSKEDVAEVLRRRFFEPDSIRDPGAFRPHVTSAVGSVAKLDDETSKKRPAAEERYLRSFPFHPDLTEIFYTRWTQLEGFQRTRGILRTFAVALRDAEKWDMSPLIGPNVFLNPPGESGLAEAASELASFASVDTGEGRHHEWRPILEGELTKARDIQSEATRLKHREVEQAVISVFLSSQPIGHKALTRELVLLLGTAEPDRIELEKALHRWTEVSWFLDEAEVATGGRNPDGTRDLPKAWRLGNRPNLRQMHDDASLNRVPPAVVESHLTNAIEKLRSLTAGASAAGARAHTLPTGPRDVQDDGQFHYAVLGPSAASGSGKPSAEARRYIDETTGPDRPRANRNAVVLAVPSPDGLEAARSRIRDYLAWLEVRGQLKDQPIDPIREQMLSNETMAAHRRIPDAVKQAYCVVVTVNEKNHIHAFRIAVTGDPLFTTIKADKRSRIQETAISSEAMMPGGPYDLWAEGENSHRVKDLVGAFARFPKLPKMLRRAEILNTVAQGVLSGILVGKITRPDRTTKTFWRSELEQHHLDDSDLEVILPEAATLSQIDPILLRHCALPGLWSTEEIAVEEVYNYFSGDHTVSVPREGYDDTFFIPGCSASSVEEAIENAVARGLLWMTNGPASILGEPVPPGVLSPSAKLRPPPTPITVDTLMPSSIPDAWSGGKTNALAIATALSNKYRLILPWKSVETAIGSAISTKWLELSDDSETWPSDVAGAQHVVLQTPTGKPHGATDGPNDERPTGVLVAKADLEVHGIQDLAELIPDIAQAAVGTTLRFTIRIQLGDETSADPEVVSAINLLLSEVSDDLRLT